MTTRDRILDAAARVMRDQGLAKATTKEIARAAALSEAALYKHFRGKDDLFLHVLHERLPPFVGLLKALPERSGTQTVEANLAEIAGLALRFYSETAPLAASLFSEPELLARHREALLAGRNGPHRAHDYVAGYLADEQSLGRLAETVDVRAVAALLLGACFERAFLRAYLGPSVLEGSDEEFVASIARTLATPPRPAPRDDARRHRRAGSRAPGDRTAG